MESIAIIIPFCGIPRRSFDLFLESCKRNLTIDWFFFLDFEIDNSESNIHTYKITLESLEKRAQEKVYDKAQLKRPYKLCDYKPFYGLMFEKELKDYDWWGYGDTDVIYGDIRGCFENIDKYNIDKINWWGHLCLMRNTKGCKELCLHEVDGLTSYKQVLESEANLGYDERDFNEKVIAAGKHIYTGRWAADIDCFYKRMRCVDMNTIVNLCRVRRPEYAPVNYRKQLFVSLDGHIFQYYIAHRKIERQEFAYIHFRKEVPIKVDEKESDFIISRDGFFELKNEDDLNNKKSFKALVQKYNGQEGALKELARFLYYTLAIRIKRV